MGQNYSEKEELMTSLKWVKQSCPYIPLSQINKLFRLRQVRKEFVDTSGLDAKAGRSKAKRVKAKDTLVSGDVILLPLSVEKHHTKIEDVSSKEIETNFVGSLVLYKVPLQNRNAKLDLWRLPEVHPSRMHPRGTMHGLMRGNVEPFPYGSVPPAHGERPGLYGGPSGAGELGPSSYGFAPPRAGELKPSSYCFAPPGAGELGPSSYGFAPLGAGAGNADPNSYYAPTAQHGFQRHNPGGSGGWFD